jgi:hypothetical protein
LAQVDDKLAEVQSQTANLQRQQDAQQRAGLIAPPGQNTPPPAAEAPVSQATLLEIQARQRKVAFIPKDDPLNPRSLTFDTWMNGQMIRIKRGDVGMLPLGHAIQLARSGHGHVIDMTAWQQVPVQPTPDLSIQNESEWSPQGAVPRDILRRTIS